MNRWHKPLVTEIKHVDSGTELSQFGQTLRLDTDATYVVVYGGFFLLDETDLHLVTEFRWNVRKHRHTAYVVYNGRTVNLRLHRLILDAGDTHQVDHRNGVGWDNRRKNLRHSDSTGNSRNHRPTKNKKYSKYKGVGYEPESTRRRAFWRARIMVNRKHIFLGCFKTEEEAAQAYDTAAKKHFGEYAVLNFEQ